jgi:tetratricopeptide (TPR) repeat protein
VSALSPNAAKEHLRGLLDAGASVWVAGPPGIGKSALVAEVLAALPISLRATRVQGETLSSVGDLGDWLQSLPKEGIVVLDGVDDHCDALAIALAQGGTPPLVLTSCRAPAGLSMEVVSLGPLDVEQAERVVLGAAPQTPVNDATRQAARQIALAVGCEPLGLALASALVGRMGLLALAPRLGDGSMLRREPHRGHSWCQDIVTRHLRRLSEAARDALTTLASVAEPFTFDVLEALGGDAVAIVTELVDHGLLLRCPQGAVLGYRVPWSVRMALYPSEPARPRAAVLRAWTVRARALSLGFYGADARTALAEASFAVPLAVAMLSAEAEPALALELWLLVADALFFGDALPEFDDAVFARAVSLADAEGPGPMQVQARLVRSRRLLEGGKPQEALQSAVDAADRLGGLPDGPAPLRGECLRRAGWAQLALGDLSGARQSFERAHALATTVLDLRGEADAQCGLGMAALLDGNAPAAGEMLEAALAIHAVARDEPRQASVRAMMDLLPNAWRAQSSPALRLEALEAEQQSAQRAGNRVRMALATARLALAAREHGDAEAAGRRLREARVALRLAGFDAVSPFVDPWVVASPGERPCLQLSPDGDKLTLPDGSSRDLSRYGAQKRILVMLAQARVARPGVALGVTELLSGGWPGEKMQHDAGLLRVYTTVRRLRKLGLDACLRTRDDGYLIDPEFDVAWLA